MIRHLLRAVCLFAAAPPLARAQPLRIALREDPDLLDPTLARRLRINHRLVGNVVGTSVTLTGFRAVPER